MTHGQPPDAVAPAAADEPDAPAVPPPAPVHRFLMPWDWLALALVYAVAVIYGLGQGALSEHEVLVGGAARQMLTEGHWIALRLGDIPWLEKPPLPQWIAAAAIAIGGAEEWVVRLPFALLGFGVVGIVASLAAAWYGRGIGLLAGLIQATAVYAVRFGRLSEPDIVLTLLITLAVASAAALAALPNERRRAATGWAIAFWVAFGLMNLVKGFFFGNGVTVVALGAWILLRRDWRLLRRLASPTGIGLAIVISLAWPVAVTIAGEGGVLWANVEAHILGRVAATSFVDSHRPWWWYGMTILWQLAPWTPLLPLTLAIGFSRAVRERRAPEVLLLAWLLAPIAALSLVSGKHHHYIMGALPAAAVLLALALAALNDAVGRTSRRFRRHLAGTYIVLAWLMLGAGIVVGFLLPDATFGVWVIGAVAWLGLMAIGYATRVNRGGLGLTLVVCLVAVVFAVFHSPLSPNRLNRETDRAFLATVRDLVPDAAPILAVGDAMGRFHFRVDPPLVSRTVPETARVEIGEAPSYVLTRIATLAAWQGVCVDWLGPGPDAPEPITGGPHRFTLAAVREGCTQAPNVEVPDIEAPAVEAPAAEVAPDDAVPAEPSAVVEAPATEALPELNEPLNDGSAIDAPVADPTVDTAPPPVDALPAPPGDDG